MSDAQQSVTASTGSRAVYEAGRAQAEAEQARWTSRARWLSNARLLAFLLAAGLGWLAFGIREIDRFWIGPPILLFAALLIVHDRILRREARAARVRAFYDEGLARLDHAWQGRGDAGERYQDPSHPYAADLDLFGRGSLFELLATTRTSTGSDLLASWLKAPAPPDVVRMRQDAVRELTPRVDLRLEMAIAGDEAGSATQQESLEAWAQAPGAGLGAGVTAVALLATALSVGGLALWIYSGSGPVPFVAALVFQAFIALALRRRVAPVLRAAEAPVESLARTASLLSCVEAEAFESARLKALARILATTGHPPSQELEGLKRLVDRRDARQNQFFAPIAALLMWGTHVAVALERWRARCGPQLAHWIAAAGEIEALCALSNYAYENPEDPFPEIEDSGAVFAGEALAHPLLPRDEAVRNDLELRGDAPRSAHADGLAGSGAASVPQALVMSGSNMSGKSTMLRTVGTNTVLALCGAPVRARSLRVSPLQLAASIRIVDSLQEGQSHFMAEIVRLRQVVEISRSAPQSLFLLDEILHGTNSHDRRIGAEAVIRGLIDAGALGIVTTHDLALTRIVPDSGGRLANAHFEDQFEEGVMAFDYALRPGVVEKSNALELMRSVGLDV